MKMRKGHSWSKKIVMVLVGLLLMVYSVPAYASGNPWYDKYAAYDNAYGNQYYTSEDSALLAWGESYVLEGYLALYELTKNTSWLTKFKTHADTMVANASDPDGDGYLGWTAHRYSPVVTTNGTFASRSSSDTTLPTGWTRFQSTSSTAYVSSTSGDYYPGSDSNGLVLKTNGTSWQKLYQPLTGYEANTKYNLRFQAKTNGSAAKGEAYIYDRTAGTILTSVVVDNTAWKDYSVNFTTPAAGHTLEIWLGHDTYTYTNGYAYFDNVSVSGSFPYLVHEGIIGIAMAKFIKLVNQNSTALSSYVTTAGSYQTFLENEIIPKWQTSSSYVGNTWVDLPSTNEGYYKESTNINAFSTSTVLNPLPFNQFLVFSEMMLLLYDVNGNTGYLDKATKMGNYFKNHLTASGSSYVWDYAAYAGSAVEDASHGNIDINAALQLYNHGLVFNGTQLEQLTDTLTANLWNGSLTAPKLHNYVNGTQGSASSDYLYTLDIPGWTKLAQFDNTAWKIAAYQYDDSGLALNSGIRGLVLAEIMRWDPVKLVNQGFELQASDDSTRPSRWTRAGSTSSTAYRNASQKASGDYGLTLVSNGSTAQTVYQRWDEEQASAAYVVTFDGKTDGSGAGGKVWMYDETTGTTLGSLTFTGSSWQTYSFTFTAPASATDTLKLYLGHSNIAVTNGQAHFDNVVIKRQGDTW
ncbi:hypothetical protein MJA45_14445 [Paenibacillus aurantius]|uniref:CBM-cenC domain-containing protein n=1 Tax=Paenibacillus aurantius TaxID=2918900 RepID=A0AA96LBG3_9BACL|nr:hypothetical protein [Paenibacillus aurantius]WNQ08852.1 hypothetical protein MJA45_14445 [Paenibacillus aurantius]